MHNISCVILASQKKFDETKAISMEHNYLDEVVAAEIKSYKDYDYSMFYWQFKKDRQMVNKQQHQSQQQLHQALTSPLSVEASIFF